MENSLVRFGRYSIVFLAVGVALYSFRFALVPAHVWLGIDQGIRGVILRVPLQALTHMIVGPIALFTGPWQFIPGLRARRPRLHRWMGRTYVTACIVAGVAALATVPFASGGPIAGTGFGILAVSWLWATVSGWRAAVNRKFEQHRVWMRFSYAMTFGAVTLRLQIPIGFIFFHFHSYSEMSVWLAYTSWIPNVIVVGIYSLLHARFTRGPAIPAAEAA